ncbi:hypothetical protein F5X96DRAFT_673410 [Biscogniauxia mediterranea]|nr:hypothetical protein F5X96DRAFT_673410 [Biscogniauxia mediterranea]
MSYFKEGSTDSLRILVQSKTHLIPGHDYHERCTYMRNLICQHVWGRNYDYDQDRWNTYGTDFAYEGKTCFFLVDHGNSPSEDVPIFWYIWTGESLVEVDQPLPERVQARLKTDYPFLRPRMQGLRKMTRIDDDTRRQIIRSRLLSKMKIPKPEVDFLLNNPDQVELLKADIDSRLWETIDSLLVSADQ